MSKIILCVALLMALMMFASFPHVQANECRKEGEECGGLNPCCSGYQCVLGGGPLRSRSFFTGTGVGCVKCGGRGDQCGLRYKDTLCCDGYQCKDSRCV